jgi:hypothetical protein
MVLSLKLAESDFLILDSHNLLHQKGLAQEACQGDQKLMAQVRGLVLEHLR